MSLIRHTNRLFDLEHSSTKTMMNGSQQTTTSPTVFLNELSSVSTWKREQVLGTGSFAIITLWVNTETNERIAMKQYKNNYVGYNQKVSYYDEQWKQEIKLMKRLKCENVVKTLDLPKEFALLKFKTPVLGLEFCSGGDLRKVLNRPYNCCGLEEKEVRQILKQISKAIEYLHSLNIIHRDLKPENIVLQPTQSGKIIYKLTDLGYAKQLSNTSLANSFVGTLEYLAPELFLHNEYTTTVDNWSFGLLAHEIVTGRRPFLPNHSMAEILEALKKKKNTDICTEIDEKGNFYFSEEISQFNQICNTLKTDLESWLKVVLEYDASKRGGQGAFRMITQLMNKYLIQVLSIETYEIFSYEIDRKTTIEDLKEKIFSNTNINPNNQYLILPNGEMARKQIGEQIIESWYTPETWFEHYNPITICAFDYSRNVKFQEFYKSLTLPPTVEKMLLDPGRSMDYDELKLTWRCSVWVAQQSVKKYSLVHEALKSCLLNCINFYNKLQNRNHSLSVSLSALFSSSYNLKRYIKIKTSECRKTLEGPHLSRPNIEVISEIAAVLNRVCIFRKEKVQPLFDKSRSIVPKLNKKDFMFEMFFKSPEVNSTLMKKYVDIQNAYESSRKKKIEEGNIVMVNLLCDCFKLVENLIENMFRVLSVLIGFIRNVYDLQHINETVNNSIVDWQKSIDDLQQKTWTTEKSSSSPSFEMTNSISQLDLSSSPINKIKTQLDQIERIVLEFEKEDQLWISKHYSFSHLEFSKLLF